MIRLLLRLAPRLAYARDKTQRWRQLSVVFGAFSLTLMVLVSAAVVLAADAAAERRVGRMPVLAAESEPAGLVMLMRGPTWRDRQFPVIWLAPGDGGTPVLPPGLRELPLPGTAVLSPGLLAAGFAEDGLGFEVGATGTGPGGAIGAEGLASASEWLAYVSPPAGRSVSSSGFPVKAFGPRPGEPTNVLETDYPTPSMRLAIFGVSWLFLLPVLVLAVSCAVALSPLRVARAQVLFRLGLPRPALRLLGALETTALAAPGVAAAAALWFAVAASVRSLPGTQLVLVPYALVLPVPLLAGLALGCLAVLAVLGAVALRIPKTAAWTSRRLGRPTKVRVWRAVPLAFAAVLMVAARVVGGASGAYMIMAALLITSASLPLAIPWLVHRLGGYLATLRRPHGWLAGRRLAFSPVALARPAVAVGALVFVVGSVTGIHERLFLSDNEGQVLNDFSLSWSDPQPGDVDWLRAQLPAANVVLLSDGRRGKSRVAFRSCADAAHFMEVAEQTACRADGQLTPDVRDQFKQRFQFGVAVDPSARVTGKGNDATVLIAGGPAVADAIWRATNSRLPVIDVNRLSFKPLAPPLYANWFAGIGAMGVSILLLALLHTFGNRVLSLVGEDQRLLRIALDAREVRAVQRWTLLAPLTVAIPLGVATALTFVWAGNDVELAVPVTGLIVVEALAVAVVSAVMALTVSRLQRSWTGSATETIEPPRRRL
ncbi:MAG: hypothetical protein H0V19_09325 [Euzebyales bacterium]|nr:hypothetical protein [Euzebyales bacterium]